MEPMSKCCLDHECAHQYEIGHYLIHEPVQVGDLAHTIDRAAVEVTEIIGPANVTQHNTEPRYIKVRAKGVGWFQCSDAFREGCERDQQRL